ncbi:MAG: recombinase family protein [Phycisphaerales bacterium]|nr:MAG: recombinase family protein [Phycisphaerales bacterium]
MTTPTPTPTLRCAVYTRKSSEEGLDQAFNSLDAQREAGLDYIKSQKHQGWTAITTPYDDGGYSGGSTDRPGLQRLLADISKRRVDVVVVYKVDRLSRSLADFARLMQTFDERGVSFVSVTQQFNTTTSMGRLTLNMLLSFAQFEREVTGERIRDKIAATKRKGVWVCGQPPLGYRLPREGDPGFSTGDRVLRVIEPEAELVRAIFRGYLERASPVELAARLNAEGRTTKKWTSSRGVTHGGRPLNAAFIHRVLTNPVYIGKIAHTRGRNIRGVPKQTEVHEGRHEPIIDRATWDRVHAEMRTAERASRRVWTHTHLLKGKLRTLEGHAMSPGSVQRPVSKRADVCRALGEDARRIVRYYVSQKAVKQGYKTCPIKSISAAQIDELVRAVVLGHLHREHSADLHSQEPQARDRWVREVIHRVVIAPDQISIELARDRIAACIEAVRETASGSSPSPSPSSSSNPSTRARGATAQVPVCPFTPELDDRGPRLVLTLRVQIKRHDGRRVLLSPDGHDLLTMLAPDGRPMPQDHLVRAIGLAYAWRRDLLEPGATIDAVAQRAGVAPSRLHAMLPLTQLSPAVLRAVFTGTLSSSTTLADLQRTARDLEWSRQAQALGV